MARYLPNKKTLFTADHSCCRSFKGDNMTEDITMSEQEKVFAISGNMVNIKKPNCRVILNPHPALDVRMIYGS